MKKRSQKGEKVWGPPILGSNLGVPTQQDDLFEDGDKIGFQKIRVVKGSDGHLDQPFLLSLYYPNPLMTSFIFTFTYTSQLLLTISQKNISPPP